MRAARMTSNAFERALTIKPGSTKKAIVGPLNMLADSQENDPRWLFRYKVACVLVGLVIWLMFVVWLLATLFTPRPASETCIPQTEYTRAHPTQYDYGNLCK